MSPVTLRPFGGVTAERKANSSASGCTGPPKNMRSSRPVSSARSGYSSRNGTLVGRLRMTPSGPPSSGRMTSTTVREKFGSSMSGCATSRKVRAVSACASAGAGASNEAAVRESRMPTDPRICVVLHPLHRFGERAWEQKQRMKKNYVQRPQCAAPCSEYRYASRARVPRYLMIA
jgi:hypothetical protein